MVLSSVTMFGLLLSIVRSDYGPVTVQFIDGVLYMHCGPYLQYGIGGPFDSPHLIANS